MAALGRHPNYTFGGELGSIPIGRRSSISYIALVVLVTAVAFAFSGALGNGFVWDDGPNLQTNTAYRGLSWSHLAWMFTTTFGGHYQPLSWLSFAVDHELWGSDDAFGIHLTNVVLHVLTSIGVYLVGRRLLRIACPDLEPAAVALGALAGALLFGVHPLRVESVAWATERRDVLSGVLLLLTVFCYLRAHDPHAPPRRTGFLALALVCYVMSLLSKATGITLPFVLAVLDVYPLRRLELRRASESMWPVLREKLLFLLPAVLVAGLALLAQARTGALWGAEACPFSLRIAQAFYGLVFYPLKTLWPAKLVPLYEQRPDAAVLDAANVLGAAVIAIVIAAAWKLRRRVPAVPAACVSYSLLVSPTLGLAQSGPQLVADRYSYISCIPFALLIGGGLAALWGCLEERRVRRYGVAAALAGVCVWLVAMTRAQVRIWRDPYTLWTTTLARAPDTPLAHANLAVVEYQRGDFEAARREAKTALARLPGNRSAHVTLAEASLKLGDPQTAERSFRVALKIATKLGRRDVVCSAGLAESMMQQHRFAEAEDVYRSLVELQPDVAAWHVDLAGTFVGQDRIQEARAALERAARVNPKFAPTYLRLSALQVKENRPAAAIAALERGLSALPDDVDLLAELAWVLATTRDDALRDGPRALDLATQANSYSDGKSLRAAEALAAAQAETGSFRSAEHLVTALLAAPPAPISEATRKRLESAAAAYRAHRPTRE